MTEESQSIVAPSEPDFFERPDDLDLRSRGTRRTDREKDIVTAAIEEFRTMGLAKARLDDIAARAGVAKGTLYLYFESKEELFKAAIRSQIHPLFEALERQVADFKGPTEELLRRAIRTMYSDLACPGAEGGAGAGCELMRLMIAEGHRMPELADFYYQEIVARGLAAVRVIIWRGIALGEFRASPAAEFPHLVLAPCKMSMIWQLMFGDKNALDRERYADAHIEFVLAALRA
jgi:AcrR family transcriptional regulator